MTDPIDSFFKHVYDPIVEANGRKEEAPSMTKSEARTVLQLQANNGESAEEIRSNVKQAYRKLSFQFHPDRVEASSESDQEEAAQQRALLLDNIGAEIRRREELRQEMERLVTSWIWNRALTTTSSSSSSQ